MSTNDPSATPAPEGDGPTPREAELMAAYEEQMKHVRVEEVVVQSLASFIELGGRRAGLVPGAQDEADPAQLQLAIEAIRALQPVVAPLLGPNAAQIDQALSQLQLAYAQTAGAGAAAAPDGSPAAAPAPAAEKPADPPAASRLWVPGQ